MKKEEFEIQAEEKGLAIKGLWLVAMFGANYGAETLDHEVSQRLTKRDGVVT